jgi:flagellar biosynthesis protein
MSNDFIVGESGSGSAQMRNPIAVALSYDPQSGESPTVVATGKGAVAEQILNIAFANGIKVRKDSELVEVLSLLDVDSPIPIEAFSAVAEILAYVYKANALHSQRTKLK